MTPNDALSAILDHAENRSYVVIGYYTDRSGAKLFGVWDDKTVAEDRARLLSSGESPYTIEIVPVKRNATNPVALFQ